MIVDSLISPVEVCEVLGENGVEFWKLMADNAFLTTSKHVRSLID